MSAVLPDYLQVLDAMHTLNAIGEPADTHGLLCALLVSNISLRPEAWLDSMLSKHLDAESNISKAQKVLTQVFEATTAMFSDAQFSLQLLLPGDEVLFEDRLEALVQWCQGFLAGLNRMGLGDKAFSAEAKDAISDLNKISCLDSSKESADEASEAAYAELVEYVRMAVMLLQSELQAKFNAKPAENAPLH